MKTPALLIFLFSVLNIFGQNIELKGKIVDSQTEKPISNAYITTINSEIIIFSDNFGKYSIKAKSNDSIIFSADGYYPKKMLVNKVAALIKLDKKKQLDFSDRQIIDLTSKYHLVPLLNDQDKADADSNYFSNDGRFTWNKEKFYNTITRSIKVFNQGEKKILGSPYLDDIFTTGQVFLNKSNVRIFVKMRYNIHADQFEIRINNAVRSVLPEDVEMIIYKNRVFRPMFDNKFKLKYFEIVGVYKKQFLIKRHYTDVVEDYYFPGGIDETHTLSIKKRSEYFIINDSAKILKPVKLKKSFAYSFFDKDKKILNFIKTNKLKMRSYDDYKKVFSYSYTLLP